MRVVLFPGTGSYCIASTNYYYDLNYEYVSWRACICYNITV